MCICVSVFVCVSVWEVDAGGCGMWVTIYSTTGSADPDTRRYGSATLIDFLLRKICLRIPANT
jgi:hypothetical protein